MFKLLSTANPKVQKGTKLGYLTFILHLAPAEVSGYNTCPKATEGCRAACLNTAGRGGMFRKGETTNVIQQARIRKTRRFFEDRAGFMEDLMEDIQRAVNYARRRSLTPVFRLNGTSDIAWEKVPVSVGGREIAPNIFSLFPMIQFYDYTKMLNRKVQGLTNYHLTFSRAESNDRDVGRAILEGMNVAVVYDQIPEGVYSADETDLRFLDPAVKIIGLRAKGRAKRDRSGFVVRLQSVA